MIVMGAKDPSLGRNLCLSNTWDSGWSVASPRAPPLHASLLMSKVADMPRWICSSERNSPYTFPTSCKGRILITEHFQLSSHHKYFSFKYTELIGNIHRRLAVSYWENIYGPRRFTTEPAAKTRESRNDTAKPQNFSFSVCMFRVE